jgi:4-hydroxybenzoyl-CoA thioesterase/acyl-CoA thioester hydrolase
VNEERRRHPIALAPGAFHYLRRVQFAETDMAGIVHFSWYLRYMEEAEHALWRAAGLCIAGDALHWPRASAHAEYRRPLRFEDEIDIEVRAGLGRSRIQYAFDIQCRGAIVALGGMTSVCARKDANGQLKPVAIPGDVRERLLGALG